MALFLLTGCAGPAAGQAPSESRPTVEASALWPKEELPVSVEYTRLWEYSASARSEDPLVIARLVEAVQALEIGEKSEWVTEDYTDILDFRFADGETLRLEFEDQCWVSEDKQRYEADGLAAVREILDELVEEED